jgi:hypothetical protein
MSITSSRTMAIHGSSLWVSFNRYAMPATRGRQCKKLIQKGGVPKMFCLGERRAGGAIDAKKIFLMENPA